MPTPSYPSSYVPHRAPRLRQAEAFARSADAPLFALFMEQRTGKTKVVLDTVAYQYEKGTIDALLIVAMPASVPRNWIHDEIPADLPPRIPRRCHIWRANKANQKGTQAALDELLTTKGLAVLAVNGEAIITQAFRTYAARFLKARKVFVVADETTLIMKTPKAKRTRVMNNIGKRAKWKRILDGTPVGEGPLDLYSQVKFLSESILGHTTFASFKAHFAEWEDKVNHNTDTAYKVLKNYQNLDELHTRLDPYVFRCLRTDCFDLPDKIYTKHYFDLSTEQRRVYDTLREEYVAELRTGEEVQAAMVLTRYLRLQQITSNYWPPQRTTTPCPECVSPEEACELCDGTGLVLVPVVNPIIIDPDNNPRLDALAERLQHTREPVIVWARFRRDVDEILLLCERLQRKALRFDGATPEADKDVARRAFQAGGVDVLVASQRAAGRGLKLTAARTHIYYSNEYSLLARLQSEDRSEGDDTIRTGTHIIDLVAEDTNDEVIVQALREKKKLADLINGDPQRSWI